MYDANVHETTDLARIAMVHALCAAIDSARGLPPATNPVAERRVHARIYRALVQDAEAAARRHESRNPRGFAIRLYADYRRMTTAGGRARARYARPRLG